MKIDWKKKLTSRKFWMAVITFVVSVLVIFGIEDLKIEQTIALVSASGTMIAYIVGEGFVDAAREKKNNTADEMSMDGEEK